MTLDFFKNRILTIQKHLIKIREASDAFLKILEDTYITDAGGVTSSWQYKLIEDEFVNLCAAVKPNIEWNDQKIEIAKNFFEYWVYEFNFGGEIEVEGKPYDLSDLEQVYNYICNDLFEE